MHPLSQRVLPVLISGSAALSLLAPVHAEVKLPAVLSSHMVLQREMPVPLWGTAAPGENVTVKFRDQTKTAAAGQDGNWQIRLDPLKAGGPDTLTVAAQNTIALDDVLVGEVWVGSGQSNMAGSVGSYLKRDPVLQKLVDAAPYPRLRQVRRNGVWQVAGAGNVTGFSALLFSFGVQLQKDLDVPVGLMLGAVGGTPSGHWLSREAYEADPACKAAVAKFAETFSMETEQKRYEQQFAAWEKAAAEAKVKGAKEPRKPFPPLSPGECRGQLGHLYEAHIRPFIPYAIRGVLWDQGESGTAIAGVDQYTLMGALIRGWRKEWGQGDFPFVYVQKPSGGGCAWDPADPVTSQGEAFAALPAAVPATGQYRENHIRIMDYPNTAMATSSDLGPDTHPVNKSGYGARAARVALGLAYPGRKAGAIYGPTYLSHVVEDSRVRIRFAHVGQGLAYRHGARLQGFAVAGEDKAFHWADAVIDGETVVVSCPAVAKPAAVRYAWAHTHPWANLFNKDGLPALPFRTDAW